MPVPVDLAARTDNGAFGYTTDLVAASRRLAQLLGNCPHYRVVLGAGTILRGKGTLPALGDVAWLVGHGLATDTRIGSRARGTYIELEALLDWCVGNGYSTVVDTCCQPDLRRTVAAEYGGLDYFCTRDGHDVTQIVAYPSLDAWWDANHMTRR